MAMSPRRGREDDDEQTRVYLIRTTGIDPEGKHDPSLLERSEWVAAQIRRQKARRSRAGTVVITVITGMIGTVVTLVINRIWHLFP